MLSPTTWVDTSESPTVIVVSSTDLMNDPVMLMNDPVKTMNGTSIITNQEYIQPSTWVLTSD